MFRRRAWARVPLLIALAGEGCSPSVDPIVVTADCPQMPFRGPELYAEEPADRLLSDFETGTTELADVANRNGSWIHGRDLTSISVTIGPSMECAARGQWAGQLADKLAAADAEAHTAIPTFEHVLQPHATGPEDWQWRRTDLDLCSYTTRDLAAQCVTSVLRRLPRRPEERAIERERVTEDRTA